MDTNTNIRGPDGEYRVLLEQIQVMIVFKELIKLDMKEFINKSYDKNEEDTDHEVLRKLRSSARGQSRILY